MDDAGWFPLSRRGTAEMAWCCDVTELFTGPRLPLLPRRTPLLPPQLRPESKQYNTIQYTAMQCNLTLLPNAKVTAPGMIRGAFSTIIRANHKTTSYIIITTTANIGVNSHYIPKRSNRHQSSILVLLLLYLKSFTVSDIRLILRSGKNLIMSVNYTKQ